MLRILIYDTSDFWNRTVMSKSTDLTYPFIEKNIYIKTQSYKNINIIIKIHFKMEIKILK